MPPTAPSLWKREPARVIGATSGLLAALNAILLGAGVYEGGAAAAVTGVLAALAVFANELVRDAVTANANVALTNDDVALLDMAKAEVATPNLTPNVGGAIAPVVPPIDPHDHNPNV